MAKSGAYDAVLAIGTVVSPQKLRDYYQCAPSILQLCLYCQKSTCHAHQRSFHDNLLSALHHQPESLQRVCFRLSRVSYAGERRHHTL